MAPSADYSVEIVDSSGQADMSVTVVGDQVVDLTGASSGDVLTVQPDGTVAPEDPHPAPTVHVVGDTGEPAFLNSWVNYGAPYEEAAFWKDAVGVVHLEGLIKSGTPGVAFVLSVGFRPSKDILMAADTNGAFGEVLISAGGGVTVSGATYTALSSITFRAA